jgi:hypothetical protein
VRGNGRGVADVEATEMARHHIGQRRDRDGHQQRDADQRRDVAGIGPGQLAPAAQAQREQQVDRQQLDHGLGQLELALHEAGDGAQHECQHDGLQQVGQQQVEGCHGRHSSSRNTVRPVQ